MKAFIGFLLLTSAAAFAQTLRMETLVSPEVHPDRRVTFRVRALKATEVSLFGDWMMPDTKQAMTRDEQGVWSVTVGPLDPGLAIYTFTVDGVTMPDPLNPLNDPERTNKKLKLLWIGCGRQDPAFERNRQLSELLTAHKVRITFHPTDGLHNFAVWRRYLAEVAPLLFRKDGSLN